MLRFPNRDDLEWYFAVAVTFAVVGPVIIVVWPFRQLAKVIPFLRRIPILDPDW